MHGLAHFFEVPEMNHAGHGRTRAIHEPDRRLTEHAQRALASHEQLRKVKDPLCEAFRHAKEVIPRTVLADARALGLNEIQVVPHQIKDFVQPLEARECPGDAFPVQGLTACGQPPARFKPDPHGHHVILDGPVPQGVRSR